MADDTNIQQTTNTDDTSNAAKDPDTWVTGDEAATGAQKSYLATMAQEAGQELPNDLTKAQASELIEELQQKTGRASDQSQES